MSDRSGHACVTLRFPLGALTQVCVKPSVHSFPFTTFPRGGSKNYILRYNKELSGRTARPMPKRCTRWPRYWRCRISLRSRRSRRIYILWRRNRIPTWCRYVCASRDKLSPTRSQSRGFIIYHCRLKAFLYELNMSLGAEQLARSVFAQRAYCTDNAAGFALTQELGNIAKVSKCDVYQLIPA